MTGFTEFEHEICSRCKGTGEHSYCQTHGKVCFKCLGKKKVLTKRGSAAVSWLNEQCRILASEVKPGHIVMTMDHYAKVESIEDGLPASSLKDGVMVPHKTIQIHTSHPKFGNVMIGCSLDTMIKYRPENYKELKEKAIAMQADLTKAGTARKK